MPEASLKKDLNLSLKTIEDSGITIPSYDGSRKVLKPFIISIAGSKILFQPPW
jgi:hypothetical protein